MWGAFPQYPDLLQDWIKLAWPLRLDILSGFTRAELRRGHNAEFVHIVISAGGWCFQQLEHSNL
jgi:hypothetical protein